MKSDKWVVEINGEKYAIDRCFSGEPAIYLAGGNFTTRGHVQDTEPVTEEGYFGGSDNPECVFILARRADPSSSEHEKITKDNLVDMIKQDIRNIGSIYRTVGDALYDEPVQRLAERIATRSRLLKQDD